MKPSSKRFTPSRWMEYALPAILVLLLLLLIATLVLILVAVVPLSGG